MSEKYIPRSPEKMIEKHEIKHEKIETQQEHHLKSSEKHLDSLEDIRKKVTLEAQSSKDLHLDQYETKPEEKNLYVTKDLKELSYRRILKHVRHQMNTPTRLFSKVVHLRQIENLSEFGTKTIARPIGIIGGALTALMGSIVLLYLSKHFGYSYNYFAFFILFSIGFLGSILIEVLIKVLFHRYRKTY